MPPPGLRLSVPAGADSDDTKSFGVLTRHGVHSLRSITESHPTLFPGLRGGDGAAGGAAKTMSGQSTLEIHMSAAAASAAGGPITPGAGARRKAADDAPTSNGKKRKTIDLGDVDVNDNSMSHMFAKPSGGGGGGMPRNAVVKLHEKYAGPKPCIGTINMVALKQERAIVSMSLYGTPPNANKATLQYLEKKTGRKTGQRHNGMKWVGIDEGDLTMGDDYIKKMGWFANVGTAGSAANLVELTQNLAEEIIEANLPIHFKLAEVQLDDDSKRKHIGLMNALLGDIGEISGDDA
jgi:hypothetical protein